MQQLSLLDYQPEPELMEESQASIPTFRQGDRVLADGKEGRVYHDDGGKLVWIERGNVATPRDRLTVQPYEPPPKAINQSAIAWQEGSSAYYLKLMLRFMEAARVGRDASPAKQASRRYLISHLHGLREECLTKIKQLKGECDADDR